MTSAPQRTQQVLLISTELLSPPIAGVFDVLQPTFGTPIDADEPESPTAYGFYVTVAVGDAAAIKMRITTGDAGDASPLVRLEPTTAIDPPEPFDSQGRTLLRNGDGIYWPAASAGAGGDFPRFAIVLPVSRLVPYVTLAVYTDALPTGEPLGGDYLELGIDFFHLAVVGDSVQWGNGLLDRDKFSSLVAAGVERETDRRVVRQVYAQTGAVLLPTPRDGVCTQGCSGEVPTVSTSIFTQLDLIQQPENVDLVLLGGCINDISYVRILDPLIPNDDIVADAQRFCGDDMSTVLDKAVALLPRATIVVTGYYQIVGPESDLFGLEQWGLTHRGEIPPEVTRYRDQATDRSVLFLEASTPMLAAAVAQADAARGGNPPIIFVPLPFGPQNAVFSSDSLLWNLVEDERLLDLFGLDLRLFPEDPLRASRAAACDAANVVPATITCLYGSVGHPNVRGARVIAGAILDAWRGTAIPRTKVSPTRTLDAVQPRRMN